MFAKTYLIPTGGGSEDAMKAMVYHEYGSPDVLKRQEIDKPVVKDDEVLVRVRAASPNPYDWHFMRGLPYIMRLQGSGLRKPKQSVLGSDMAGQVEAVGKDVTRFRPGDDVFANVETGGFAEYTCVSESFLELKPANLTFEQAAAVPLAALTALQGLRDAGRIQAGQKVLIIGASGGGDVRRADREVVRRGRDRRVQHEERRHGPLDRRGPCHRLHPRGLHPE
jgi:NADPH:quinone reductase-like Zn-dependent oxidoreductase